MKAIIKVNRRLFNKSKFSIPTYIRKVAFVTYTCKKAFSNLWFWTGNKTTLKNSSKSRTIFEFFFFLSKELALLVKIDSDLDESVGINYGNTNLPCYDGIN